MQFLVPHVNWALETVQQILLEGICYASHMVDDLLREVALTKGSLLADFCKIF